MKWAATEVAGKWPPAVVSSDAANRVTHPGGAIDSTQRQFHPPLPTPPLLRAPHLIDTCVNQTPSITRLLTRCPATTTAATAAAPSVRFRLRHTPVPSDSCDVALEIQSL